MKKLVTFCFVFIVVFKSFGWGATGHRVIGLIAERHLSKKARKNIEKVLQGESLAEVSNFMDHIKSDRTYRHMSPWHYATIPDGKSYEELGAPAEGDIIEAILRLQKELTTKNFSDQDESFSLKCLVHLVGDIHQPLHVGNGTDRGGNDLQLEYFWEKSNLHRVWDSGIIDGTKYSYTEYADWIDRASPAEITKWQKDNTLDWANESKEFREQCYATVPENKKLSYRYDYENRELVNKRLLQAGIRLAYVLNQIYG